MVNSGRHFLRGFLKVAPLSHALWRSVEALEFSKIPLKKPVLDLGCGFGEFAGVVFKRIEVGIDIDDRDLKKALKGHKYKNIKWADARKLPFPKESFSTVISVSVLEHIPNVELVFSEVNKVLTRGGLFIFSVPTSEMYNYLLIPKLCRLLGFESLGKEYFKLHCSVFRHVNIKPDSWWKKKLQAHSFQILQASGTISPLILVLHELFLPFALPSQLWKKISGKRLIISSGLRLKILPLFFGRFVHTSPNSKINMFFIAKKL